MPRRNLKKPLIIASLKAGTDPIKVAAEQNVVQSYVYRLDKQRRMQERGERLDVLKNQPMKSDSKIAIVTEHFQEGTAPSGTPVRLPTGDLFKQVTVSSLHRHGGDVFEEYLRELRGYSAVQTWKEMGNNAVVAAVLQAVKMTLRRVKWFAKSSNSKQKEAEDFLNQCMDDMEVTWHDFIDQALSMIQYGFSPFETVYKIRRGRGSGPGPKTPPSRYNDRRIGWKKFAFIGQDTLAPGKMWEFDDYTGDLKGLNQYPPPGTVFIRNGLILPIFVPLEKMILFRTTTERNNPEGKSLLRPMYESFYYVKNLVEMEAISAERMGAGFPVVYLGEDVSKGSGTDTEIAEFRKIVRNIRVDDQMGLVIPFAKMGAGARESAGVLFELVSPPSRGGVNFDKIITRHEHRMAMVGLAQFIHMGMQGSGAGVAMTNTSTDFFQLAVTAWSESLKDTINRFAVDPLFALNSSHFDPEDHPVIDHTDISEPDLKVVADYINKTVGAQVITPDDRLEESLRRLAGFPDKDDTTAQAVMIENNGDGGQRIGRVMKARPIPTNPTQNPANNQRNQNPVADKPTPAMKPEARKPMRASEDTEAEEFDTEEFVTDLDTIT